MDRQRIAWTLGALLTVAMAARLVGRVPIDEDDRQFADRVAQVRHAVRARYVDEVGPEKLRQMQQAAINGMLATLDEHTQYFPPAQTRQFFEALNGNFVGIGVNIERLPSGEIGVASPIEGGPAFAAGIETGDVFTRVDDASVAGLDPRALRARIVGEPGTRVRVTVRRYDGGERTFDVARANVTVPTVTGYARTADGAWDYFADRASGVAYVRIAQFNDETAARVRDAVALVNAAGGRGLVLDLRFNGGGRLEEASTIADLFLDAGPIVSVTGRMRPSVTTRARLEDTVFRGPLAVLVNGDSASASEILAGALADNARAAIVGTRTYGKGSVQEVEDWGDEGSLKITVAKWLLPSGKSLQRTADSTSWGVDPTIEVRLSDEESGALAESLERPIPIPPRSHPTTRPARAADRQLEAAIKAVQTQLYATGPTTRGA